MNKRIEICGPIASGKSTLAEAFSKCGFTVEKEDFSKVSMLDDFYTDPLFVSFETELSFTLQHYYQIKKTYKTDKLLIYDFSSANDYAFALSILNAREMDIYESVFSYVIERVGRPQKLIRLRAPTDELILRINRRGRKNEQNITKISLSTFVKNLDKTIERFYEDVPLLELQTEQLKPSDYENMDIISNL